MKTSYEKQDELLFQAVDKMKAGDAQSFNQVYEYSKKYIYKIIYDVVKDEATVEDLMQETYLQIYNKIDSLENSKTFLIWAGRIATNYSLRYLQKRKEIVAADLTSDDGEEFVFDTVADDHEEFIPEDVVMDQEKVRLIGEILDRLSPEQKIAVQFFYYEEMSVKEIAKACDCSEGTIKSRLNYARKSIKEAVIDLEVNKDTKLYSLASLPLFYLIFRKDVAEVTAGILGTSKIAESVAKQATTNTAKAATTKAAATAGKALGTKIAIGVAAVAVAGAVVGGTAVAINHSGKNDSVPTATTQVAEESVEQRENQPVDQLADQGTEETFGAENNERMSLVEQAEYFSWGDEVISSVDPIGLTFDESRVDYSSSDGQWTIWVNSVDEISEIVTSIDAQLRSLGYVYSCEAEEWGCQTNHIEKFVNEAKDVLDSGKTGAYGDLGMSIEDVSYSNYSNESGFGLSGFSENGYSYYAVVFFMY